MRFSTKDKPFDANVAVNCIKLQAVNEAFILDIPLPQAIKGKQKYMYINGSF